MSCTILFFLFTNYVLVANGPHFRAPFEMAGRDVSDAAAPCTQVYNLGEHPSPDCPAIHPNRP